MQRLNCSEERFRQEVIHSRYLSRNFSRCICAGSIVDFSFLHSPLKECPCSFTRLLPISWCSHVGSGEVFEIADCEVTPVPFSPRIPEFYIKNVCICIYTGGNGEGQSPTQDVWNRTGTSRWRVWHISCRNVSLRMHRNVGHDFRMPALVWIISISRFKNGSIIWRRPEQRIAGMLIRSANISSYDD